MACAEYKDLLMGYLDNELADGQREQLERNLAECKDCWEEMEEFKKLKSITDDMELAEPEDKLWEDYWGGIYNRIERGVGWILFSIAAIVLLIYGGFRAIEEMVKDPTVSVVLKVGLLVLIAGLAVLFVSVLRERLYFRKKDRYEKVKR